MKIGRLQDKVAIVTGSTKGIGEAIARGYAKEGAKVIVCGRNRSVGEEVVKSICEGGGQAHFVAFDLTDEQSVTDLVASTLGHFGDLDIVVHNAHPTEHTAGGEAGLSAKVDQPLADLTTEAWRKVTLPTFDGMFWVMRETLKVFKKRNGGCLINISSMVSMQGLAGVDIHTATKGAMNALTRSVAVEYAANNIRCNCIVVGMVATGGTEPLVNDPVIGPQLASVVLTPRIGLPKDFVGPAVFLASDEEAFFVTGQCISVDGGMGIKMRVPELASAES